MNLRATAPPMWYWLLVLLMLNVVDVYCTQVEVVVADAREEANPLMRSIINLWDGSLVGVFLFKMAFLALLALMLSHRVAAKIRMPVLIGLTLVYTALTGWHVYTIWMSG